ncbi:MAG: ATP-binding cassette domain-containing protein, partial [Paramuribaculum sp.]|nr:ATP-binding cassette domain-containing protein [Paramuribaculum sp.]
LYGARTDFRGKLLFNGISTSTLRMENWQELRRRNIAYLPQELSLFPELTALENVKLKNRLTGHFTSRRIDELFEQLGISSSRERPAGLLSIGQQQRVAIIRTLCQPFDFLLIDEPVSHLDARNNGIVASLIAEEADAQGAAVIATSVGNKILLPFTQTLKL